MYVIRGINIDNMLPLLLLLFIVVLFLFPFTATATVTSVIYNAPSYLSVDVLIVVVISLVIVFKLWLVVFGAEPCLGH